MGAGGDVYCQYFYPLFCNESEKLQDCQMTVCASCMVLTVIYTIVIMILRVGGVGVIWVGGIEWLCGWLD